MSNETNETELDLLDAIAKQLAKNGGPAATASTTTAASGLNLLAEKEAAKISVGAAVSSRELVPDGDSSHLKEEEPKDLEIAKAKAKSGLFKDISTDQHGLTKVAKGYTVSEENKNKDDHLRGNQESSVSPATGGPPTLNLQRDIHSRPSSRPGAVAVAGSRSTETTAPPIVDTNFTADDSLETAQSTHTATGTNQPEQAVANDRMELRTSATMPSARLVNTDEEANIQSADPVQEGELRLSSGNLTVENKTDSKEALKIILLIAVVGIVVLGLVLGLAGNQDKDAADVVPTTAPTVVPSAAPTSFAATLGFPDYSVEKIVNDSISPQARAYAWLMDDPNFETYPDWRILQRFALATFYYSTGGTNWAINDNWLNHTLDECKHWFFLTETAGVDPTTRDDKINVTSPCDDAGRYQYLLMGGKDLTGSVPREIGMLSELLIFDFEKNYGLEGSTIPSEIGLLTNLLRLSADRNYLGGTVPTEIGLMTSMVELYLGYNPFPSTIPTEIANMRELKKINLNRAGFTGTFPSELYTLPKMQVLLVHGLLGITEATMDGVWQMTDLEAFYAHNLPFHNTPIPSELGLATKLQHLLLWDTGLTGTVPSELANLSILRRLDIDDNQLTGSLPDFFLGFPGLEILLFDGNHFTGTLPSNGWQNLTSLRTLAFSENQISGTIPTEVGLLQSMQKLHLDHNIFTGTLPTEIGNLTALKEAFFHETYVGGNVPSELESLPDLNIITLSDTFLTGSIPAGICDSLVDVWFSCETKFRVTLPTCTNVEVEDFDCRTSLLCGCSCEACPGEESSGGFFFNMTFDP
ncbi:Leucine Rich Repeat [Seminavis robusta]|uniref:Leucine Rich Repeat n=1 Tax=Seminavis robusta TaxID=568900 RepID=A0A9N8HVD5_9STRA|nr:Leucine Rich Repeat [Seminavis robusta]|eukprot:Sro1492_g277170.1 Leucine Rich Repeat (811) ;mRNA; f:2583-5106